MNRFARKICLCANENPIHFQCLKRWVNKNFSSRVTLNSEVKIISKDEYKCEICQSPYPDYVKVGNKRQKLLDGEYQGKESFIQLDFFDTSTEKVLFKCVLAPITE